MGLENRLWQVTWAILGSTLICTLFFSAALSSNIFVFDGNKTDVGTILLTAATVVLTGVALVVAVVGLWGFNELKNSAIRGATDAAQKVAAETAREVAQSVATRTVLDITTQISGDDADELAAKT